MSAPVPATAPKYPNVSVAPRANGERKVRVLVPENETPEQRFKRLGSTRINKCLKGLRNLETIFRSPAYSYSPQQAGKAVALLTAAVEAIQAAAIAKVNRKEETVVTL
jgi:hypothetical protein